MNGTNIIRSLEFCQKKKIKISQNCRFLTKVRLKQGEANIIIDLDVIYQPHEVAGELLKRRFSYRPHGGCESVS